MRGSPGERVVTTITVAPRPGPSIAHRLDRLFALSVSVTRRPMVNTIDITATPGHRRNESTLAIPHRG
jgi:hypothetical protein